MSREYIVWQGADGDNTEVEHRITFPQESQSQPEPEPQPEQGEQ